MHCTKSCIYSQKVLLRMGEFVSRNMLGLFKKINKRKSCCILLVVHTAAFEHLWNLRPDLSINIQFDIHWSYSQCLLIARRLIQVYKQNESLHAFFFYFPTRKSGIMRNHLTRKRQVDVERLNWCSEQLLVLRVNRWMITVAVLPTPQQGI